MLLCEGTSTFYIEVTVCGQLIKTLCGLILVYVNHNYYAGCFPGHED